MELFIQYDLKMKMACSSGDLMFVADDDGSCYTEMYLNDQE